VLKKPNKKKKNQNKPKPTTLDKPKEVFRESVFPSSSHLRIRDFLKQKGYLPVLLFSVDFSSISLSVFEPIVISIIYHAKEFCSLIMHRAKRSLLKVVLNNTITEKEYRIRPKQGC